MAKTNKELAVELMGEYLKAIYSQGNIKTLDEQGIKTMLTAFYNAVKSVPDN